MGLDMYAYITPNRPEKPVDFKHDEQSRQLFYWRKHPDLHGWMGELYLAKGGKAENGFNCETVTLTLDDLDALEKAVRERALPHTEGFFFGESDSSDFERDLEFIAVAREAIQDGYHVFYDSWW